MFSVFLNIFKINHLLWHGFSLFNFFPLIFFFFRTQYYHIFFYIGFFWHSKGLNTCFARILKQAFIFEGLICQSEFSWGFFETKQSWSFLQKPDFDHLDCFLLYINKEKILILKSNSDNLFFDVHNTLLDVHILKGKCGDFDGSIKTRFLKINVSFSENSKLSGYNIKYMLKTFLLCLEENVWKFLCHSQLSKFLNIISLPCN